MGKIRNKYIVLFTVLLLTSVTVNFLSYDTFNKAEASIQTIEKIPLKLGKWQGVDVSLEKNIYEILETRSIIHRKYFTNDSSVFLSVVYYPETKVDFHAPEACLGGLGVKTEKIPATISIATDSGDTIPLKINRLIQKQDNSNTLVYYFYKTESFVGRNYIKLRLNLVLNKFKEAKKSGSLIRVTPLPAADNGKTAHNELENFISSLLPYGISIIKGTIGAISYLYQPSL